MPRITALEIRNYRSIGDIIRVEVPEGQPIVLVGENNSGKSNIIRALNLVLGARWPGNHDPEDHEFHLRDRTSEISIAVEFATGDRFGGNYTDMLWQYDETGPGDPVDYGVAPSQRGRDIDWVRGDDRDECVCMVVEADRNLDYHLSYRSKFTLLSKLMHSFHKELTEDQDTKEELEQLFGEIKDRFENITQFSDFSDTLSEQLINLTGNMTHSLEVDFQAYNPTNFFRALRLQAAEEGEPRTLEELGTGEKQVLALSFAYAYATAFHGGIILVIEEPEAHLHPLAQRWLADRINDLCEGGLQVVLTTHSPNFIDLLNLEGMVLVRKPDDATRVIQKSTEELVQHCQQTGAEQAEATNILPFYAAQATNEILEGFFAKAVVLVEGDTEALALPVYLERCGLETNRQGVAVIGVGGKGNLAKWKRLFEAYDIPTYIVFDNDGSQDDEDGTKRRDALQAVGIDAEDRDDFIEEDEWRVEENVSVFGENFEHAMRNFFSDYEDLEADAGAAGVSGKPFVARWVASSLDYDDAQPGWEYFERLSEQVGALI